MGIIIFVAICAVLAAFALCAAYGVAQAIKPPRSIPEICDEAIKTFMREKGNQLVADIFAEEVKKPEYACFRFVKMIQWHLKLADPTLPDKRTFEMAMGVWREFVRDEKVKFGDPRYDWTSAGARDLAQAYEIDHWERAA